MKLKNSIEMRHKQQLQRFNIFQLQICIKWFKSQSNNYFVKLIHFSSNIFGFKWLIYALLADEFIWTFSTVLLKVNILLPNLNTFHSSIVFFFVEYSFCKWNDFRCNKCWWAVFKWNIVTGSWFLVEWCKRVIKFLKLCV